MKYRVTSKRIWIVAATLSAAGIALLIERSPVARADTAAAPAIPPAVQRKVDFAKDVAPIFEASCMQCHANGTYKADLSIESRAKMLEGGASSPAITPGDSANSLIVQLVSGQDPDRIMPKKGSRLTPEQIGVLRAWIDQGANWPKGFVLQDANKPKPAPLPPRNVPIPPPTNGLTNPIDLLLQSYFQLHKIKPGNVVNDRVFARRVYLDVIGLLPTPAELDQFLADTSPDKRANLVHKLLNEDDRFATHWMSFWNDLLRNDYKGTGYIDGGRLQITRWLYDALKSDMPYDEFVRQLVTGTHGSEGFIKGIVWRGVVNSAQTPQMQAAQNVSQVFMGVNLKCASCHDSFVSQWKLTDSYGLAGVFADKPLEMERCTKPLGQTAPFKFLYPELGTIDPNAPKDQRVAQLAKAITSKADGRLTRTIINRLWQRLMGRALVEPVDEMDLPPWDADLLDALAWKLANDDHYDLKKTMETILLSRAYQFPSVPESDDRKANYVFAGPMIKRMTAEQFTDSVSEVCGVWTGTAEAKLTDAAERFAHSKWIWNSKDASKSAPPGKVYFRREVNLKHDPISASTIVAADNRFELYVNGHKVISGDDWNKPTMIDLKPFLVSGKNVVAAVAENTTDQPSPAGFFLHSEVAFDEEGSKPVEVDTNVNWKWSATPTDGWTAVGFDDSKWAKSIKIGEVTAEPWHLSTVLPASVVSDRPPEIRAALCAADPLTTALGRPNRDQVVTERPEDATTLMALELTNGATLDTILQRGAKKIAVEKDVRPEDVVNHVYAKALGRTPTDAELSTAKSIVGSNVPQDGVEDFLWSVVMLPEFQLIR